MRLPLVVIIPSALVLFFIKSTEISLVLFRPAIRSRCTIAILSDALIRSTIPGIVQTSPYRMKIISQSVVIAFSSPLSSFMAAITGFASSFSMKSLCIAIFILLQIPLFFRHKKRTCLKEQELISCHSHILISHGHLLTYLIKS